MGDNSAVTSIVDVVRDSMNRMDTKIGEIRDDVKTLKCDTGKLQVTMSGHLAYHKGAENGAAGAVKTAMNVKAIVLGALTAGGAVASAVWFIAERLT